MLSYRASLAKIGIPSHASVSYRACASSPPSLRQAIRSVEAPTAWNQLHEVFVDESWTQKCNGVVVSGEHWIFSSNGSANPLAPEPTAKGLYVFKVGGTLRDDDIVSKFVLEDHHIPGGVGHVGQLSIHNGTIYLSHFNGLGAQVVVFQDNNGSLELVNAIQLDRPRKDQTVDGRDDLVEFQAVNPWDGMFYTSFGSGTIHEFFMHHPATGKFTGRSLRFDIPILDPDDFFPVQGACFSPNGHLYVASNMKLPSDPKFQTIWYYSALNGHQLGVIPVLAEESDQELEGICYADMVTPGGHQVQIHAVLLETRTVAKDNIFLKSFSALEPDVV